jgi:hypothetical protein
VSTHQELEDTEIVRRYAMLGVVAYAEKVIREFFAINGCNPSYITMGELEWTAVMEAKAEDDFSIASVVVLPAPHIHSGVQAHA